MANRYWVGGTASWDGTAGTKWATTSGGAGGAAIPTSSDDVFFDANSGSGTVTIATGNTGCLSLNCTGFTGTLAGSAALTISGGLTMGTGMTRSFTSTLTFNATSGTNIITSNGKTFAGQFNFTGAGGTWQMADTFSNGTSTISLTAGTLDFNGQTITSGSLSSSGSTTRTMTCGASTINLSTGSPIVFSGSNFTFNANTSQINITTVGGCSFSGGSKTFYNVSFTSTQPQATFVGINVFNNLTMSSVTSASSSMTFSNNQTINGTLTITGTATARIYVKSDTLATQRTLTAAAVSLSYCDFTDMIGAGTATWTGTSLGDGDNNSGITFTTPVTRYWVGNSGNFTDSAEWSSSSGGAGGATVPIIHDTAIFDANSFSGTGFTVTINSLWRIGTIDFSAVGTDNPTLTFSGPLSFFNNFTLKSGMTTSGTLSITYAGRRNSTLTTAGVSLTCPIVIDAYSTNKLILADNLTTSSTITLTTGHLDALTNNVNVTATTYSITGNFVRTLSMGSGTWTATSTGTVWNSVTVTNLTLNQGTSTIKITNTGASAITFSGGGKTYYNLWFDRGSSTANLTIVGSNTFNDFKDTGTAAHSILFTSGTTQTVTTFTVNGTAGNLITINSTTTATHALTKSGGGTITCDYLNIQHSVASPGSTWYANNSVNNQSVATAGSGWTITSSTVNSAFFAFM